MGGFRSCWWARGGLPFTTTGSMGLSKLCTEPAGGDQLAWVQLHPWGHEAEVSLCLLVFKEGNWVWDKEWALEQLLPLDRDLPVLVASQRPEFVRHQPKFSCRSAKNCSWHWWWRMLGTASYYPLYTCSSISRISLFTNPSKLLMDSCSGAIFLAVVLWWEWGYLCTCHCQSLFLMVVALWK